MRKIYRCVEFNLYNNFTDVVMSNANAIFVEFIENIRALIILPTGMVFVHAYN